MSERDAFGPNLRRTRIQRGISLESIAAATKIGLDLLTALEQNDFSEWPTGIYARASIRAYATEIGVDPEVVVNDFCRWFPQGDRRAERVVRDQAAIVGHDLQWRDDLVGVVVERDRRARAGGGAPILALSRYSRLAAALVDAGAVVGLGLGASAALPVGKLPALAASALLYHAVTMAIVGCTPAAWAIDTYLTSRHPSSRRKGERTLRVLRSSERVKV
jgi:transcriptional regulator with XRE-family HTH domain